MTIYRSDVFAKDENGGEVFKELTKLLTASSKKTIEEVLSEYKKDAGLESISIDESEEKICVASIKNISCRHIEYKIASSIYELLKSHPEAIKDIESFCFHSGGNKSLHSIIHFLREQFGKEDISYSDKDLIKIINELKAKHKSECPEQKSYDAGVIGTQNSEDDMSADYYSNSHK